MLPAERSDAPRDQAVAARTGLILIVWRRTRHGVRRRTSMEKIPLTAKGFAKLDAELKKLKSSSGRR